jgi:dolichol-phosphate mannosyltransferase
MKLSRELINLKYMKNKLDLTIVPPTFNEKGNVNPLLDTIEKTFKNKKVDYEVLFVDDSSDETPEVIEKEIKTRKGMNIRMIHRPKNRRTGLATAFIEGFEKAKGDYICCIDSDLQHPPQKIYDLYQKAIKDQAEIVFGTRYTKGGSAEGLGSLKTFYGIYRRAVSMGLKYFTQILFIPARKTSDPLGGFFLLKKSILKGAKLYPRGFKISVEVLMRTEHNKVSEVPYKFLARENDDSKATLKQGLEFFKHLWNIFRTIPEAARFLKFCIVGGSGVLVNLGTLFLLVEFFHFGKNSGWAAAVILSIFTNYFLNSIFTYGDKKSETRNESMRRVTIYYAISFFTMIFNFLVYKSLMNFGVYYIFSAFVGILAATILNFVLVTKLVWRLRIRASKR